MLIIEPQRIGIRSQKFDYLFILGGSSSFEYVNKISPFNKKTIFIGIPYGL